MAYTDQEKEIMFTKVCEEVAEGKAVRNVLDSEGFMEGKMFYELLELSTKFSQRYARAAQKRADAIFEDTLNISDNRKGDIYIDKDGNEQTDHAVINRDKLRVETRKWITGKLWPKKYGDKMTLDHSSEDGTMSPSVDLSQYPPEALHSIRKILHDADKKKAEQKEKEGK